MSKTRLTFHFSLFTLAAALAAPAQVLILHEKLAADNWVLAVTWLDTPDEIGGAVAAIEADPAQRRGPSFVVLGGVRLRVVPIETPGPVTWEADETTAGQVVVFWQVAGSNDPADWHAELFADIPAAQAFISEVKADPARALWDERPLQVDRTWQAIPGEPQIQWLLQP